jgi:prephenate dehydrogenase
MARPKAGSRGAARTGGEVVPLFEEGLPVGTLAIWGVGLIGGSLGMAWRKAGVARTVIGIGRDRERLEEAVRFGAIDQFSLDPAAVLGQADVTVLCSPVEAICRQAEAYGRHVRTGGIVTDAGSTKRQVVAAWEQHLAPGALFVGGHPMAGSEKSGVVNARADLCAGARWVLTPGSRSTPAAVATLSALARAAGAEVLTMTPEAHDRMTAFISHLPQMVAVALAAAAGAGEEALPGTLGLAAGGFRDTTRIAASSPAVWQEIFFSNDLPLRQALAAFREALDALESAVGRRDEAELARLFRQAHRARQQLPPNGRS